MLGKNKKKGNENANKVTKAMILQAQMAQMEKSKKKSKKNSKVVEAPTELEENINKLGFMSKLLVAYKNKKWMVPSLEFTKSESDVKSDLVNSSNGTIHFLFL